MKAVSIHTEHFREKWGKSGIYTNKLTFINTKSSAFSRDLDPSILEIAWILATQIKMQNSITLIVWGGAIYTVAKLLKKVP